MSIATASWASTQPTEQVVLKPSLDQRLRSNLATKFLANWHYKDTRLDDELSVMIFDRYLDLLDPNYSFFYASDIETFQPYRLHLDEALQHSDPSPADEHAPKPNTDIPLIAVKQSGQNRKRN